LGGKSHEFVVELLGVGAGPEAITDDGVLADAGQACGLADAAPLGDVVQDGDRLVFREAAVEEGGALTFGEAGLAGAAIEEAAGLPAVVAADGQVALAAATEVRAVGVVAAENAEVVHSRSGIDGGEEIAEFLPLL
jgi:hypothetical protein